MRHETTKRLARLVPALKELGSRFRRDTDGASATEFAILVPIFAFALLLMVDVGQAVAAKFDVERKMRLAIEGVLRYGDDTTKVMAFANASGNAAFPGQTAAPTNDAVLSIQPYYVCRDSSENPIVYAVTDGTVCPGHETWYQINATASVTSMFGKTFDLSTSANMLAD